MVLYKNFPHKTHISGNGYSQTIEINFGTDSLELGGDLGSSITKGFLYKSVLHDNGTCMGIPENKLVVLSQNQPQIVNSTGWIITASLKLELE